MNDTPALFGLPLHPLLVHAAVVLIPLAVLAVLLSQFWPAARRRLGMVTPLLALVVAVLVPITAWAGMRLATLVGPLPAVQSHGDLGRMLIPAAICLFVVAAVQWAWLRARDRRRGDGTSSVRGRAGERVVTGVVALLVVAVSAWTIVLVALTGDSGARAVWGGLLS